MIDTDDPEFVENLYSTLVAFFTYLLPVLVLPLALPVAMVRTCIGRQCCAARFKQPVGELVTVLLVGLVYLGTVVGVVLPRIDQEMNTNLEVRGFFVWQEFLHKFKCCYFQIGSSYNGAAIKIIIVAYSKAVACVAASTAAVVAVAITSLGVSGTSTTKMFSLSQNVLPCYQESGIKFIFNTSHSFPDRAPSRLPPLGAWQHCGPANHLLPHQPGRLGRPEGNVLQEEAQVNLVSHIETSKFKFI